ncbi:ADP-ribosylation factor-binding protein GGA1-like isoform X2 [Neophocaena asiaeorientalis asiaeorientalis]|uniref:ADP-ribosylation factor-binding protein GGA1-like isoform X2 n=1 Tax=Neophocaena asiaeorientalis asiaeorientalis TaxID=1706337 RepID=A0A341CSS2_NEOAA|nr:ADP-ribosylation factor-binding protein GGA1-like isoform X2 [Neophocaena asiaeorientalis asiaeorientalis]
MLARLLKSSHPEDLRAANRLIKEMVQEDQKRMEKISRRVSAIEEVNSNVRLLTEMVMNHSQGGAAAQSSEDLMKELYQRCERLRPTLFRLASDTEDNDEALGELQLEGGATRGPPSPAVTLGFSTLRKKEAEIRG